MEEWVEQMRNQVNTIEPLTRGTFEDKEICIVEQGEVALDQRGVLV
ncbi:MAG: hypothetical protein H8E41_10430 [Desulfobulbaceae bacterium]|uniref:Uncharacterized protein n=1 Tax=Candidatus Desulfobia pelagia TaxID=2841692 RepID=A0A8J6NCV6_9BACT|nr:hypothetical protein [Candidatus Desulfobia pelagia]